MEPSDPSDKADYESYLLWASDFESKAARRPKVGLISESAIDMEVSDESQMLFLIDSQSADPNTTIRAFDKNGNLVPRYSIVIPEGALPVRGMGFAVIGSILYMFGGICIDEHLYDSDDGRFSPTGKSLPIDTDTYFLDVSKIPGALDSGEDLSPLIQRGARLNHSKFLPIVYVVNETLYVLSSWVHNNRDSSLIDFESCGPSRDSPVAALPNPPFAYYGSEPQSFHVVSHALAGDQSIVISLDPRFVKGIYVFNLKFADWTRVDTDEPALCFIRHPFRGTSGSYYALSPTGSTLVVLDQITSIPKLELPIREASSSVSCNTSHYIATMDGVIFIFRTGSPSEDLFRPLYLSIDKYKVHGDSISPVGETILYLYTAPTSVHCYMGSLYLLPVSL